MAFSFSEIYLKSFSSQLKCFMFDVEIVGFRCFNALTVILGCKMQGFPESYKLRNLFQLRMHHIKILCEKYLPVDMKNNSCAVLLTYF